MGQIPDVRYLHPGYTQSLKSLFHKVKYWTIYQEDPEKMRIVQVPWSTSFFAEFRLFKTPDLSDKAQQTNM